MEPDASHPPAQASIHRVGPDDHRLRLDRFLHKVRPDLSRRTVDRLLHMGAVLVDGAPCGHGRFVKRGERVEIRLAAAHPAGDRVTPPIRADQAPAASTGSETPALEPREMLRTPEILIVAKPPGMTTNPALRGERSLLDWARDVVGESAHPPGVLHRLDRDASGLVAFSLTPEAHRLVVAALGRHRIQRRYLVLVAGHPQPASGTIALPLARTTSGRIVARDDGERAVTRYRVLAERARVALLDVRPLTGRTHQIRAHLSAIGHPVVGDPLYGDPRTALGAPRLWLHAAQLRFPARLAARLRLPPVVVCPLWADLAAHLNMLGLPPAGDERL
jgi:RluA family pseudouridine synthase